MIKRITLSVLTSLCLLSAAAAQNTQSALTGFVASFFPDNTSGLITPANTRTMLNSMVLSSTCTSGSNLIIYWGALGLPTCTASPQLGVNGGTGGSLGLNGATSGSVTLSVAAAAGSGTAFKFPNTNGAAGQYLATDGAGVTSWAATTRLPNPSNLYVTTAGNDSNLCTLAAPCLTLQRAVNVAVTYDLGSTSLTINIGSGAFTKGAAISGTPVAGAGLIAPSIIVSGAGSANTTLGVTDCASGAAGNAIYASYGANVSVTAIKITNACSNVDLWADNGGVVQTGADVILGVGAGTAFAHLRATTNSRAYINSNLTISGNSGIGFSASTGSSVIFAGSTITISGAPTIGNLLNAIDNSSIIIATSTVWSGAFTGQRFAIALGGMIDTEQTTTALPGSLLGAVGTGSVYYTDAGQTCVGGAALCPVATAPTGLGGAGTAAMGTGSSHHSGKVRMTAAVGAAATGAIHISPAANLTGQTGDTAFCVASLANGGTGVWANGATYTVSFTASTTAPDILIVWVNNAVALTNGSVYEITYMCM